MKKPFLIGIDGPTGAGKTTVAKSLARVLGIAYVDTGAFYRALAYWFYQTGHNLYYHSETDEPNQSAIDTCLRNPTTAPSLCIKRDGNGEQHMVVNQKTIPDAELRSEKISQAASRISTIPSVREFLLEKQRDTIANQSSVMEGRDVCTAIMPNADLKIFMDTDLTIRAERRHLQLVNRNKVTGETPPSLEEVTQSITERDERDTNRNINPLQPCADSLFVKNHGSLNATVSIIINNIRTDVTEFIAYLYHTFGESLYAFQNGLCYHFAHMLKANFDRGEICWAAPLGHIVWRDDNGLVYDSEGIYTGSAEYIIPIAYIQDHIEDFTHFTEKKSSGATEEFIQNAIKRYLADAKKTNG